MIEINGEDKARFLLCLRYNAAWEDSEGIPVVLFGSTSALACADMVALCEGVLLDILSAASGGGGR
jgi:hypothetical protein